MEAPLIKPQLLRGVRARFGTKIFWMKWRKVQEKPVVTDFKASNIHICYLLIFVIAIMAIKRTIDNTIQLLHVLVSIIKQI